MNAKSELEEILKDKAKIKCAEIFNEGCDDNRQYIRLQIGYTETQKELFLKSLDFKYDSGYGGQELFGIVWLIDDTWLSRGEYDGSEWWEHNKLPEIPEELLR